MSVGTPFHPRTAPRNAKQRWREWAGYLSALQYHDAHDVEYAAIREGVALLDVSPLFKYLVRGPDAPRLVDRVTVRDVRRLAVGQVWYTCWCDEDGKVVDDGTVARLDETTFRWTAADPSLRWLLLNAAGLDVEVLDVSESVAALALQGPLARRVLEAATGESFADLRYFHRRPSRVGGVPVDVTRTGYTGDLGYELWVESGRAVELWDALWEAGSPFGLRPAGLVALDVVRVEAGLLLLDVDYTSSRRALAPEQAFSPFELGVLGRFVDFGKGPFVGRRALEAEGRRGGPPRRLVGLELSWEGIERAYAAHDLPPVMSPVATREHVPVYAGRRQVGRATSTAWSPLLKRAIALASVAREVAAPGTELAVEWTVEARRGAVAARVVPLPFFDPPRKRATPPP
ncbi:MAG TPA: aminomethyltransferase family protein [Actinomycetota bacterium]|nr:aminomethyltransferase family protein [Actinomycetota bacterium]